ncbi:MAG TPA: lipopolysaccharide kinase InaA family protein [Syntrophorhabdaceae bacterium]|nr:lipopolysaccharide kinase InaA family protein [Syntrophorhabdaceae bacterium]
MDTVIRASVGPYTITCRHEILLDGEALVAKLLNPHSLMKKGRGEIRVLSLGEGLVACRKYIHGGLLRALTGDAFLSEKRAASELEVMTHLENHGFPTVKPYGYITKRRLFAKDLYLLTVFEEDAVDLVEFMNTSNRRTRMRVIRDLAHIIFNMCRLGVYHPDLHLKNALVTKGRGLRLLDFDRAYRKAVTKCDIKRMFWRLNRFAEKRERAGDLVVTLQEKVLFLKVFERLSGYSLIQEMQKQLGLRHLMYRLGWWMENTLYGKKRESRNSPQS